ncbi:hypothetical protein FSP39_024853 [Pinctada imbricata]|uniref:Small vasohibin-binding protein n=1 Tax=Pinctada imbricata TaxID=66713 RepID=A0AA88YSC0_PINIB|nr:hypothetical protein FSP39_024853 [Pinctada imbricata]
MSVLVNRSTSAFLRLSHANKYPNDFLFKQNTDTVLRPTSGLVTKDAVMKIDSKLPDVLLNFDRDEGCVPPESFSVPDVQNSLLHSDSNLRPVSRRDNAAKPDSTNNAETPTESEETDNGSHSGLSLFISTEKNSNKQSKKRKRAKSGRASKNRHGNSSKGKRQNSSNTKSGTTSTKVNTNLGTSTVKVKDIVNGVAGLGILDSSICKPVILHKPSGQERKNNTMSENIRRRENLDVNRSVNSKSANAKNVSNGLTTKSVTLPQMSNNFMVKSDPVLRLSVGSEPLNSSRTYVQQIQKMHNNHSEEITRITKIFLSDKHSGMVKDCGMEIPMAPPATPTPEQLRKVEYVPSMNDIRSQRAVKVKLQVLEREAQKKSARRREEVARMEKQNMKEREKEIRLQQRQEIYALNKVMTELENGRFKEFCVKKGISIT